MFASFRFGRIVIRRATQLGRPDNQRFIIQAALL
jgi:hypothetical protein